LTASRLIVYNIRYEGVGGCLRHRVKERYEVVIYWSPPATSLRSSQALFTQRRWRIMATNGHKLAPKKMRALTALLEYPTIVAAAESAGVGQRTLTRWMTEDEEFQRALTAAQTRALDQTITRLSAGGPIAADTLIQIASNEYNKPSVRVQAAARILAEQRAGINLVTLKNELDELRSKVDELTEGN
jgi:hypothetical protein